MKSGDGQKPGFRRFVLALSQGLERAGFDLGGDVGTLVAVVIEMECMRQRGDAGHLQINIEGTRGVVSVSPHLKRVGAAKLKQKWGMP